MTERVRVLCIDGGGVRGLIPTLVLAELERRSGRPTAELFDFIAGTSAGGIIASGLVRPDASGRPMWRAEEIAGLYDEEAERIFSRSLWWRIRSLDGLLDERFQSKGLEAALDRYLGAARLSDAATGLLVPAYETVRRTPFVFDSELAREDPASDFPLRGVARATSAGPTYFEAVELPSPDGRARLCFIDGGVYAVNPAMLAVAHVRRVRPGADIVLVSLGTGDLTRPLPYRRIKRWGMIGWARAITEVTLDGTSHAVDRQLRQILGDQYWRFQVTLPQEHADRDDPSAANRRVLRRLAEELIAHSGAELDGLLATLTSARADRR